MKHILLLAILSWVLGIAPAMADENKKEIQVLKNTEFKQQMSYSLGYDIYSHISQQVEVDMDAFLDGVADAKKGTPRMDEDQMRQMLVTYQRMARLKQANNERQVLEKNRSAGAVFLEGNKLREGVITLSSGLQYRVVKQGKGPKPAPEDTVECHYRGTLLDGTVFDSSHDRGRPAVFQVSKVIAGWTQALQMMPVGSKWELFVPASLAYGDAGAGQAIQPGHTLIFEVELLGIVE